MRVALFCIMAVRTKHIHAQRSFHLLKERHKTLMKRLVGETTKITRGTFIHSYTVRLSKSPFFPWLAARPHRSSLRSPYRLIIELMRGRLVASLLHCILKVTVCHSPRRLLGIQPRILTPLSRIPKTLYGTTRKWLNTLARNFSRDKLRLMANFKLASREKRNSTAKDVILATGCLHLCLMELNDQIKLTKRV